MQVEATIASMAFSSSIRESPPCLALVGEPFFFFLEDTKLPLNNLQQKFEG
jgi:hypothetical protein